MRGLFDLPAAEPGLHTLVIIVHTARGTVGLSVDALTSIVNVTRDKLMPLPPGQLLNDCAEACFGKDAVPVHLLCPERLVLEQEWRIISQSQAAVQARLNPAD